MAIVFSTVVLLIMIIISFAGTLFYASTSEKNEKQLQKVITSLLARSINRISFSGKYHARLLIEEITESQARIRYITILDLNGNLIASNDKKITFNNSKTKNIISTILNDKKTLFRDRKINGEVFREVVMPYRTGYQNTVNGIIFVGLSLAEAKKAKLQTFLLLLPLIVVLTLLSLIITFIMSKKLASPVISQAWQFKKILDNAPVYIHICDENRNNCASSASFYNLPADIKKIFANELEKALIKNQCVEKEINCKVEGVESTFITNIFPVLVDKKEKIKTSCLIALDLTERKKVERELKNSQTRLKTLIEALPDLIWLKDPDGFYLSCNLKFERFFGASESEIQGKTDYDFVEKDMADFFRQKDLEAIKAGKPCVNEEEIIYADDGHRELLETIKTPMFDGEGKLIGVLGIAHDITERKQVFENLKVTLNSIADAVIATDKLGRIVQMNPVAERLTNWNFKDVAQKQLEEVFHVVDEKTREVIVSPVDKVINNEKNENFNDQLILIAKGGREFKIAESASAIKSDKGETLGIVIVFRDITEEYAMQKQLQHSQKMDAIGQLAGGIAHDFNNMLGGIIGSAELLDKRLKNNPKLKKISNMILVTSERAAELTQKLLAFSRKQQPASTAIDIHETINDSITLLARTIDKRIRINSNLEADYSKIIGDSAQVQSIFLNLGINAAHAMPNGGDINIETSNISIDEEFCSSKSFDLKPGKYLDVTIKDNGCGIPDDNLGKIFEPFFTTKQQGKGTGLGLAAVYGTVQQHKGCIDVSSIEGEGTLFHILLPLADSKSIPFLKRDNKVYSGKGKILVVDDEEIMRITAKNLLEELGYEVVLASEGDEALQIFQNDTKQFDLVILDMIMPEMNGKDCFKKMIQLNSSVKVILASGFSQEEDVAAMKTEGLAGFIGKPYRISALSKVVFDAIQIK